MPEQMLTEKINKPPYHFVIASITRHNKGKEIIEKSRGKPFEITLLVNGQEIPFSETIEDIYSRIHEDLNKKAAQLAHEKLTGCGLNKLFDLVDTVEHKLKEELTKIFGVDYSTFDRY